MFKFIHAADIHLDSPLLRLEQYEGATVERLRRATRRALENLVELAISESADFVAIAGDLYDGDWRDYNTGLFFVKQLTRLKDAGIRVFVIAGNHDAASAMTRSLKLPDNAFMLPVDAPATARMDSIGVAIHGQGFSSRSIKSDLSADYPPAVDGYFNIGMLHTCATGRPGHEDYAPCTADGLASRGYDYWALGHVHQREVLRENPPIVFPGNIQGRNIRETGPKGCLLVTVDDTGIPSAAFHPLDVVRWEKIEINLEDFPETRDPYDMVDLVYEELENRLEQAEGRAVAARVEISGNTCLHPALASDPGRWTNEIRRASLEAGDGRIWAEKVKILTTPEKKAFSVRAGGEFASTGPVAETLQCIESLKSDPNLLQSLRGPLADFFKKLPRELRHGDDAVLPDNPRAMETILDQVAPMLLDRLLQKSESGEET